MPDVPAQLGLNGERLALYEALSRRSERIAVMYVGIHFALRDTFNPERFVLASHAIRELMEKVSEIVSVRTPARSERMGNKVAELERAYERVIRDSKLGAPKWNGETDGPIQQFLERAREFFEWKKQHVMRRKEEVAKVLRALDGPGRVLPADLESALIEQWENLRDYFVNIAHHQASTPTPDDFDQRLVSLEHMLLRKLNPPTFADFDALDAIIEAGERKEKDD